MTWLRAGYPEGIPTGDYVALLGVLRRRLHEDEIAEIVELLAQQRELGVTSERIRELIREYSLQDPYEADVERVTALLREAGYPVDGEEFPEDDEPDDEPDAETSEVDLQEPGPDGADRP
ncbi:DUF3349 domain-containing protein [Ornithinimicrobium humiphilum]|uniref:DUF3349 domain-containing protein n=1 Tax=Ornithinimicrobium humiphilum TaxID=125288 RepID=UPI0031DD29D0